MELGGAGYTIPAGWTFLGFPFNHFSEEKYDDPFSFNPWRWKVILTNLLIPLIMLSATNLR